MKKAIFSRTSLGIDHIVIGLMLSLGFSAMAADVVVPIKPYAKAFKNPLKGFMGGEEYATTDKLYIPWKDLESSKNDGVDKIIAYSNTKFASYPNRNLKIVPRVYLFFPSGMGPGVPENGMPSDWPSSPWTDNECLLRIEALAAKMGQAWNNDPRVAWIQMGIFESWGEADFNGGAPPPDALRRSSNAFIAAFPNKLVTVRNFWPNEGKNFGCYWDSWGCSGQAARYKQSDGSIGDRWKYPAIMEGEVSYNYCPPVHTNGTADMQDSSAVDRICEIARWWHSTGATWIGEYQVGPSTARGAERFQMTNGYRLVIDTVRYTGQVTAGGSLTVRFGVTNTGAAQFLYKWPVEVSLLNPSTKQPVWKTTFPNLDIRQWLPGDKWDYDAGAALYKTRKYLVPPVKYTATGTFTVPSSVPAGEYVLALAILDPDGGALPCARFAITNYWNGGRHPIGKIGVGVTVTNPQLAESEFNDLKADNSLRYVLNTATNASAVTRSTGVAHTALTFRQSPRGLELEIPRAGSYELVVTALDGKVVAHEQGTASAAGWARTHANPAPGIYLMRVKTVAGEAVRTIAVH